MINTIEYALLYWIMPSIIAYLIMLVVGLAATKKQIQVLYRTEKNTMKVVLGLSIVHPLAYAMLFYFFILPPMRYALNIIVRR